jgi:hypothetical protein
MPLLRKSVSLPMALKFRRVLDSKSRLRHFRANGVRIIPLVIRKTCAGK